MWWTSPPAPPWHHQVPKAHRGRCFHWVCCPLVCLFHVKVSCTVAFLSCCILVGPRLSTWGHTVPTFPHQSLTRRAHVVLEWAHRPPKKNGPQSACESLPPFPLCPIKKSPLQIFTFLCSFFLFFPLSPPFLSKNHPFHPHPWALTHFLSLDHTLHCVLFLIQIHAL